MIFTAYLSIKDEQSEYISISKEAAHSKHKQNTGIETSRKENYIITCKHMKIYWDKKEINIIKRQEINISYPPDRQKFQSPKIPNVGDVEYRISHTLLVGVQTNTTILESNLAFFNNFEDI